MKSRLYVVLCAVSLTAACQPESAIDVAEDQMEANAEASASAAGPAVAALGLSEQQLLNADLIGPNDIELGDVAQVLRGPNGQVDRLLVEVEDSDPDRYVHIPISGLSPINRGNDTDLTTKMDKAQIDALPPVPLSR